MHEWRTYNTQTESMYFGFVCRYYVFLFFYVNVLELISTKFVWAIQDQMQTL